MATWSTQRKGLENDFNPEGVTARRWSWYKNAVNKQFLQTVCSITAPHIYPMILMSSVGYKDCSDKQKSDSLWSGCNAELFAELIVFQTFLYISCIRYEDSKMWFKKHNISTLLHCTLRHRLMNYWLCLCLIDNVWGHFAWMAAATAVT